MAYTRFKELPTGRRGGTDNHFHRQYTRVFQIVTDSAFYDSLYVIAHPSLPPIGSTYFIPETTIFDSFAEVIGYEASQPDADMPTLWHVEVQYSTRGADINQTTAGGVVGSPFGTGAGTGGYGEEPTQLPPQVEWKWVQGTKLFEQTADPVPLPVQTKANEKFAQVPEVDDPRLVYQLVRAEALFDVTVAADYMNTVNLGSWKGFAPRRARIIEFSARLDYQKKRPFWWVTYQVAIKYPHWDFKILHHGTQAVQQDGGVDACVDRSGNKIASNLDANGLQQDPDVDPVYLTFKAYEERNFDLLNLP